MNPKDYLLPMNVWKYDNKTKKIIRHKDSKDLNIVYNEYLLSKNDPEFDLDVFEEIASVPHIGEVQVGYFTPTQIQNND